MIRKNMRIALRTRARRLLLLCYLHSLYCMAQQIIPFAGGRGHHLTWFVRCRSAGEIFSRAGTQARYRRRRVGNRMVNKERIAVYFEV